MEPLHIGMFWIVSFIQIWHIWLFFCINFYLTEKALHRFVENKGHNILSVDYNRDGSRFATAGRDYHVI